MGLFKKLKKAVKGVRKALHLPAITIGNVAKVAGATAIGGPLAGAGAILKSKLKSAAVGGVKQVLKSKAEKALVSKVAQLAPKVTAASQRLTKAIARPGGAPIAGAAAASAVKRVRATHSRRKRAKSSAPRKAPTGGLDLKALSASWKAAGKPGKWLDWVKSHR